jgi:hypothetical protein
MKGGDRIDFLNNKTPAVMYLWYILLMNDLFRTSLTEFVQRFQAEGNERGQNPEDAGAFRPLLDDSTESLKRIDAEIISLTGNIASEETRAERISQEIEQGRLEMVEDMARTSQESCLQENIDRTPTTSNRRPAKRARRAPTSGRILNYEESKTNEETKTAVDDNLDSDDDDLDLYS